ncbi:MAG: EamA family transporter [Actinobacteria bacterium]|nr:EamA family transporter [Actinomycetota bacterium]
MSRKGWLLFIALCVIWGIPYLLIRVAVRELPPPALVFLRTAPAALLLVPLALHRGELRPLLARWRWVVVYTVIELAVPWLLLSHAEERISSSLAGLLVATVPLIAAVLSLAVGAGEHFDARRVTGLVIGFAGVAALVGIDTSGSDPLAVAEMFVVALCYASGPLIISRRLAGLPTLGVIAASLALTAVFFAPAGLLTMPASLSAETVGAVATLALVCTVLAFLIFFALIREVGPSRATVITYVNPLVAVLLGVVILSEPLTLGIAVGMPLILLGSVLGTASALKRAGPTPGARDADPATVTPASPPTP